MWSQEYLCCELLFFAVFAIIAKGTAINQLFAFADEFGIAIDRGAGFAELINHFVDWQFAINKTLNHRDAVFWRERIEIFERHVGVCEKVLNIF